MSPRSAYEASAVGRARLCSDSQISLVVGRYRFQQGINEFALGYSARSSGTGSTTVETSQPQVWGGEVAHRRSAVVKPPYFQRVYERTRRTQDARALGDLPATAREPGPTRPDVRPAPAQTWRRDFNARSISRFASLAFMSLRLSATFFPRATANSSLARPPLK